MTEKGKNRSFPFIFFLIMFGISLVFLYVGFLRNYIIEKTWTASEAIILSSEVGTQGSRHNDNLMYLPVIKCQYVIDGEVFESNPKFFTTSNYSEAQEVVDRYRPDSKIVIRFNPSNKQESAIPNEESRSYLLFGLIGLFGVIVWGPTLFPTFGNPTLEKIRMLLIKIGLAIVIASSIAIFIGFNFYDTFSYLRDVLYLIKEIINYFFDMKSRNG